MTPSAFSRASRWCGYGIALHAWPKRAGPDDPDASKTAQWLVNKECRNASDWQELPDVEAPLVL